MTLAQALGAAAALGLERLDAQVLLLHAIGREEGERAWLLAHDADSLEPGQSTRFVEACRRRASGEPIAYIVGHKEFYGLDLLVDPRVLVPRPDTETLVEWALSVMPEGARMVDLGTGSGAIALAIKKSRPDARVEATDRSEGALAVARENAARHELDVEFRAASWLEGARGRYDLIVSNPPYVAAGDPHLAALTSEPPEALASGPDGLDDLRAIVRQAPACLSRGGWLLLEHGYDQGAAVRGLLAAAGFASVETRRDLGGNERCSGGQRLELG